MLSLVDRLIQNPDGTFPENCTPTELALVHCVSSLIVVKPAFEADRLCDDFIATVKSNALITRQEIKDHRDSLNILVQLYAVMAMHNCFIQVGDDTKIKLKASPNVHGKEIAVSAAVEDAFPQKANIAVSCSIFTAHTDPALHCHPDLLNDKPWDREIELSPDKRISPLR
jgi:hypothetical protein